MAGETPDTPSGKETSTVTGSLDLSSSMEKAYEDTVGTTDGAQAGAKADTPATPPADTVTPPAADPWKDFDPDKLPQDALNKLFAKFQPKLTERAEEFKSQKEALADRIISAWERQNGGQPAPPSIEQQIKAAIDDGNFESALQLANAPIAERLSRIEMAEAQKRAYETALATDPTIRENDAEIAKRLQSDPILARMAAANGFAAAPLVLRGINAVIDNEKMKAELQTVKNDIQAQVKAGVEKALAERRELINRTGTSLTQAGKILSPDTSRKMDLGEAMEVAYAETIGAGA